MKKALIKVSGKTISNITSDSKWIELLKNIKEEYDSVIIVHGAGVKITEWSAQLGINAEYFEGHRITDADTMDVVAAVQGGLINLKLVSYLQSNGIESIGLSGVDRGIFTANYLNEEIGFVGDPEQVGCNKWLDKMLHEGVIPVFSSICKDESGNLMNVNADLFANALAVSLKVDTVFFISDIEGVYINGVCQNKLTQSQINRGIMNNDITDGMVPKLLSCMHLLSHGIDKIWIGNETEFVSHKDNFNTENIGGTWIGKSKKIAS